MPMRGPPFRVASIQFAFEGNPSVIPLRDPKTLAFLGATRPRVRVIFQRTPGGPLGDERWRIGTHGKHRHDLGARRIRLTFDANGLSQPVDFRFAKAIPRGIGEVRRHWTWYAEREGQRHSLGITRHLVYHTWRAAIKPAAWAVTSELPPGPFGNPDAPWVYLPLMHWTCRWAAGRRTDKSVCDAILANLRHSGLRYAVGAWNVGQMLLAGGGYCGGWFRMFQAMAGAHGVRVHRRAFLVDWRVEHHDIRRWCAIVVSAPGLLRKRPAEAASTFHDSNIGRAARDPIQRFHVRRYHFWGHPGGKADGHCINFLQDHGRWYLYDSCFFTRPVLLRNFGLPRTSATRTIAVERLGTFQKAYLNRAVGHMLGSLRHGEKLYRTRHPDLAQPSSTGAVTRNGLTVKTAIIPERWRNITFYWMP